MIFLIRRKFLISPLTSLRGGATSEYGTPYPIVSQARILIGIPASRDISINDALSRCLDLGLKFPEVTTWIRANREDFKLVKDIGIKETGILVSCSDYHIFHKLKMTRKQALEHYLASVSEALEAGLRPRCQSS